MAAVLQEILGARSLWGNVDAVVTIQPTSPLRTSEDIDECIRLLERRSARSVVSVRAPDSWFVGEHPMVALWRERLFPAHPNNGACYVTRVDMIREGRVFDDDSWEYLMPASRSLDINTPADLEEARRVLGP